MPETDDQVRKTLNDAIEGIDQNQRIFGLFSREIKDVARATLMLNGKVEAGFKQVDKQFEQVGKQFEEVGKQFEQVDQRFEQVDRRFEQVDQRFEQVDQRFDQVDQRFEQVDQRFDQMERRFDRQDTEVGLLQDSVRKMDARLEKLVGYIIRDEVGDRRARG